MKVDKLKLIYINNLTVETSSMERHEPVHYDDFMSSEIRQYRFVKLIDII